MTSHKIGMITYVQIFGGEQKLPKFAAISDIL